MTGQLNQWRGNCTRCGDIVDVDVISRAGRPLDADLDPARFVCAECRDPRQAGRQLQLDDNPEPDVFGRGRHETIPYPPDMVRIPL